MRFDDFLHRGLGIRLLPDQGHVAIVGGRQG
jgi:hypothetical protein